MMLAKQLAPAVFSDREIAPMTVDLGTSARQALIALMVSVTKVSNPDLRTTYRTEIDKATRAELTDAKLITWEKGARGAIFHELTDKGWRRARNEFLLPPPERVTGPWLLHYATLRHLALLMQRHDYELADIFVEPDSGPLPVEPDPPAAETADPAAEMADPVEERVRGAYFDLAEKPGDLIALSLLRARLADVARADLDRILRDMDRRREIHLDPDPGRNSLPQHALDAAIVVGGEEKHLITIGRA
jgi:hypothetical protein